MRIWYGKRAWVPKQCPKCGNMEYHGEGKLTVSTLSALLSSWRAEFIKHPFWRMKRWCGWCPKCCIRDSLREERLGWDGILQMRPNTHRDYMFRTEE